MYIVELPDTMFGFFHTMVLIFVWYLLENFKVFSSFHEVCGLVIGQDYQ